MENLGLIVAYLAIGWVLQRTRSLPEQSSLVLNQYVIYVAVPALILLYLPSLELSRDVFAPLLTPWAMYLLAIVLVLLASKIFHWGRELTGALLVVVPLGNTSFLGFPFVEAFYGKEGLPFAVIYDQTGSFLALALISSTIAAHYSTSATAENAGSVQALSIKQRLAKLLVFPPVIALIAALLVGQTEYPSILQPLLENLAATLIPVVMIAVGLQLRLRIASHDMGPFTIALTIKLLILPFVALAAFILLGVNSLAAQVSVLEAAMPPMITGGAIAIGAGLKPRLVAAIIGYGVLIGMVTLPIMAWIIELTLGS
ncbi:MAG TPA: AEC family transporter [Aliidiomarina sp.]|nr:AEC family transporter [Aliidiomarina sp.]